jgi:hypothetical protein
MKTKSNTATETAATTTKRTRKAKPAPAPAPVSAEPTPCVTPTQLAKLEKNRKIAHMEFTDSGKLVISLKSGLVTSDGHTTFDAGSNTEAMIRLNSVVKAVSAPAPTKPKAKKAAAKVPSPEDTTPPVPAEPTKEEVKATLKSLTPASLALFIALAEDSGNWSGTPCWGVNVGGSPEDNGNLTDLKTKGLVTTFDSDGFDYVQFTALGGKAVTAVLKAKANGQLKVPAIPAPKDKPEPKPAAKKAAKPDTRPIKSDPPSCRMTLRYAAIAEVMELVKAAGKRTKDLDAKLVKLLESKYAQLYCKLRTVEKVAAYTAGIIEFCYAACRITAA